MGVLRNVMTEQEARVGPSLKLSIKNGAQVTHFYSILDNPTKCSQAPYDEFV